MVGMVRVAWVIGVAVMIGVVVMVKVVGVGEAVEGLVWLGWL